MATVFVRVAMVEMALDTPVNADSTYALDDAPAAIRRLEEGHTRGKVVVTV